MFKYVYISPKGGKINPACSKTEVRFNVIFLESKGEFR